MRQRSNFSEAKKNPPHKNKFWPATSIVPRLPTLLICWGFQAHTMEARVCGICPQSTPRDKDEKMNLETKMTGSPINRNKNML